MANLSLYSKGDLAASLDRAKAVAKRARETTRQVTERTVQTGLAAGAGYAVGVAKNTMGGVGGKLLLPGTQVEADLAAGIILSAGGILGLAGDKSPELLALGNGVLAGYLAVAGYVNGLPGENR